MKYYLGLLIILLLPATIFAQEFKADFDKFCQEGNTTKQLEVGIDVVVANFKSVLSAWHDDLLL